MHVEGLGSVALAAGWIGQGCFFTRFFVQWLASERARHSVIPRSFWWISLVGALLMSGYAASRGTPLLLFGFLVSAAIATRNLALGGRPGRADPRWTALVALAIVAVSLWIEIVVDQPLRSEPLLWIVIGLAGQALWLTRFPLQWWLSERAGHSHFPLAFWWVSLAGNSLLLAYALHLGDPVFVLGFLPGPILQTRNLFLAHKAVPTA